MVLTLEKYSLGMGDRFGCEGKAQLDALVAARQQGIEIVPIWNKSHREHQIIGSHPDDVRREADQAVADLNWAHCHYVDADHIGLHNVDAFIPASDFFTFDVAESIGRSLPRQEIDAFVERHRSYIGSLAIDGIDETFDITEQQIGEIAAKYLAAIHEAGNIYRHLVEKKGEGRFIVEVSMDETDDPQTPIDLFFILSAIAEQNIPAQTFAPKFTGRFNKGVDYVGDLAQFEKEFNYDLAVIACAVKTFNLPDNLKLSLHSGSDKFSIYPIINHALKQFDAGIHVKTAGTTWLEELIGLALTDDGLPICKTIYRQALNQIDELCKPYQSVIDIHTDRLPTADEVDGWNGEQFVNALRHCQDCPAYNADLRQLLHIAFKVAAKMGPQFTEALQQSRNTIAEQVTYNLYHRHLMPLFVDINLNG